jgi:hypothetical protein
MRRGDRNDPDTDPFSPFYGRRGRDGRQGLADHYRQRDFPQNPRAAPRLTPDGPYGGLSPRNPDPRMNLMNPYQRMNPMNGQQGQAPLPPMDDVKKWVLETCGGNLEEATGSMKIKDIPDDIAQFVVHKPTMKLQTAFKDRKRKNMYESSLMFHGTPLPNLQPILEGGFKGGHDGAVWVAKEPLISLGYALRAAMWGAFFGGGEDRAGGFEEVVRKEYVKQFGNLAMGPYASYGALLGCEYVGNGRSGGRGRFSGFRMPGASGFDYETTCTRDHRAVMVRYVFLIPPDTKGARRGGGNEYFRQMAAGRQEPGPALPLRSQIKKQMMENMENIEARIEGRRRLER